MNTTNEARLFAIFDHYSKTFFACFVAELFANPDKPEYLICFRPSAQETGGDQYASYYLHLPVKTAEHILSSGTISSETRDLLSVQLSKLKET
jgi:hypothetical protein